MSRMFSLEAAALALPLLLGACAAPSPSPGGFTFGVMGDTPYDADEERIFLRMMRRIHGERLEFVVHVGDITSGHEPCDDALLAKRRAQLDSSAHPLIYTPGDNEWTDCRRRECGSMNPLERLPFLRRLLFAGAGPPRRRPT